MAKNVNKVILLGKTGNDSEIRATDGGTTVVRENSRTINRFVRRALHQPGHMFGWKKYLIDRAAENKEIIEVLSKAFDLPSIASSPSAIETVWHCLNLAYSDHLAVKSECEKLLADDLLISRSAAA
jgi:tRNA pseudouridine-54 N-methylase